MRYTRNHQAVQEPQDTYLDSFYLPRISHDGRQLPSVAEYCELQRRADQRLTYSELRQHICLDFELGFVSASATMQRLLDQDLYGDPETFIRIFCAGVRALQEKEAV